MTQIRALFAQGWAVADLAERYRISVSYVYNIIAGRRWKERPS